MIRARALILAGLLAAGCHGSAPTREAFPAFYRTWDGTPPELRKQLDTSRASLLARTSEPERVLAYARATGRLARWAGDDWLENADAKAAQGSVRGQRQHVLDATAHSLSLFRQVELAGGTLDWQDRIEMAWLYLLGDRDAEADAALSLALEFDSLSDSQRASVVELRMTLRERGSAVRDQGTPATPARDANP